MSCTVNRLIARCEEAIAIHAQYIYGAKWQVLNADQINALRERFGSNCVWQSDNKKAGKICSDCSGLISSATGIIRGSSQYKKTAVECYPINARDSSMRGWAVWENGHIGIYDGHNGYYAMDGSARNAVHYPLSKNSFTHILKLCDIDYGDGTSGVEENAENSGGFYNNMIDIEYAVMIEGGKRLPFVRNLLDYAGIQGRRIVGIAARSTKGTLDYGVTTTTGKEYPIVHKCNWKDSVNGWAGDGKNPVAKVKMYLNSPNNNIYIYYRVSPIGKEYYPWQRDLDRGNGMDGYAGYPGMAIDRLQAYAK